jgi:4-hydroxy-tetrahydrodipicolinate reductase
MSPINIMVNGMPGNMAALVAKHALSDSRFDLIPQSLTGPEIEEYEYGLGDITINLIKPENREKAIQEIKNTYPEFLSVDYSHPSAVNGNADFYCKNSLPFVMGTTGGNREALGETVASSSIAAVIAPNMARQIVGFQAMMEYAANTFADLFKGYSLEIRESHQHGKADTSGTAKAMVEYFNRLGLAFEAENIVMERDPEIQKSEWRIPEAYLTGHGWHTYSLVSDDKTVRFEFTHNVNGRDVYAKGTLEALDYLQNKINQDARGKVFTMIDVLKGN